MLADDVACEIEMLWHPIAHRRQIPAERQRHDVLRLADENRAIANAGMALDVLDHLGVVVGGQERLVLAAGSHRHVADEVGEPGERGLLQLGMLVPVMVDVPGLVGDRRDRSRLRSTASWKIMKFAISTSSIRRIAWKACRSCSPDSSSMCRDSLASRALRGWTRSPLASSSRVTGSCASQSTCRSG